MEWGGTNFKKKNAMEMQINALLTALLIKRVEFFCSVNVAENKRLRFSKLVVPEEPYKIDMPSNRKIEEKDPRIKYFSPASIEKDESFFDAANT